MLLELCVAQTLLSFEVDGSGPVRFGVPLPSARLERGLRLEGHPAPRLQWRLLQSQPGLGSDRLWVEIAADGVVGRARLCAGGDPPQLGSEEPLVTTEIDDRFAPALGVTHRWKSGAVDSLDLRMAPPGGSRADLGPEFGTGRSGALLAHWSEGWIKRRSRVRIPAGFWRKVGLLPSGRRQSDKLLRSLREGGARFDECEAPGEHGRGDSFRFDREVANGEFDRSLGCLRLALRTGDPDWWRRAYESARHLADVDLDRSSGLPFRHGPEHRRRDTELGHVWIRGLREVGLCFADRPLLEAARRMARSLAERARNRRGARGERDRLRDEAWPLWELEEHLRFESTDPIVAACDVLVGAIRRRWDAEFAVFRYGEGEPVRGESYYDRIWQTCALLLPSLRLARERGVWPESSVVEESVEERFETLVESGRVGFPLGVQVRGRELFRPTFGSESFEALLAFDGLSDPTRKRLFRRLRSALESALPEGSKDFATRFVVASRCGFVLGR